MNVTELLAYLDNRLKDSELFARMKKKETQIPADI